MANQDDPWFQIRADYEAGVKPIADICAEYQIKRADLESCARKFNWVRNDPPPPRLAQLFAGHPVGAIPGLAIEDLEDRAALTQAQILNIHRKDLARLRGITSTITFRLEMYLSGKAEEIVNENGDALPFIGARESVADLAEKLSRVMTRSVQMERQAYGLDAYDPEQGKGAEEYEKVANDLWSRLNEAISEKAVE